MDVAAMMRAVRALRGISQRELARLAGVPTSTVDRIEAGSSDPRVSTLDKILRSAGTELAVRVGRSQLQPDPARERLIDGGGRHFPPHWEAQPVEWLDSWWGWWRKRPRVRDFPPTDTYWRRWGRDGVPTAEWRARMWDDAT